MKFCFIFQKFFIFFKDNSIDYVWIEFEYGIFKKLEPRWLFKFI